MKAILFGGTGISDADRTRTLDIIAPNVEASQGRRSIVGVVPEFMVVREQRFKRVAGNLLVEDVVKYEATGESECYDCHGAGQSQCHACGSDVECETCGGIGWVKPEVFEP